MKFNKQEDNRQKYIIHSMLMEEDKVSYEELVEQRRQDNIRAGIAYRERKRSSNGV